jgi:hypothetical protein
MVSSLGIEVEEFLPNFTTAEVLGRRRHGRLKVLFVQTHLGYGSKTHDSAKVLFTILPFCLKLEPQGFIPNHKLVTPPAPLVPLSPCPLVLLSPPALFPT